MWGLRFGGIHSFRRFRLQILGGKGFGLFKVDGRRFTREDPELCRVDPRNSGKST